MCNFIAYLRNCFGSVDIVLFGKLIHWIDLNNSDNTVLLMVISAASVVVI